MTRHIDPKHLLLAAAATFALPGAALAQDVEDRVRQVQEEAADLQAATNELNQTVAQERVDATEERGDRDTATVVDGAGTNTAARDDDDDDGDEGKWGLLGLLGLAGLLGLRRRNDHRHDHLHDHNRTAGTTGGANTDRRI